MATPGVGLGGRGPMPYMTPRTGALYASNERSFITTSNLTMRNPADAARNYANMPVHRLAAQMSGAQQTGNFVRARNEMTPNAVAGENKML